MPFKKVDEEKRIENYIRQHPEYAEELEKADNEYEDIKIGKAGKKLFGECKNLNIYKK